MIGRGWPVLVSLLVFNRRRPGDIARVKIEDSLNCEYVNLNKKQNQYIRFSIQGKIAIGVPVMVHLTKLPSLKLVLKYRKKAGVSRLNPYLFVIPGRDHFVHLEADRLLKIYSKACNHNSLSCTELRKHLATNCAQWDLQDVQIKDIADYMGHHERIHMEHYRIPSATRDITRISNILEKAQGESNAYKELNEDGLNSEPHEANEVTSGENV
ncbi:hypothetical protein HHI36_001626, partial [Cryptolaemus montrouzieri]